MARALTILSLLLSLLLPVAAGAAMAEIDLVVVEINDGVKSSFVVKNAFTPQIDEAIASGVPTSFTFRAEVNLSHGLFWFDERFAEIEFRHTVKYDTLKQEYTVVREELGKEVVRTADNAEMKRLMSVVEPVRLLPTARMKSGEKYDLRIKAELSEVKLPLSLDYLFFFVKLWDFETDWYYHSFTYR